MGAIRHLLRGTGACRRAPTVAAKCRRVSRTWLCVDCHRTWWPAVRVRQSYRSQTALYTYLDHPTIRRLRVRERPRDESRLSVLQPIPAHSDPPGGKAYHGCSVVVTRLDDVIGTNGNACVQNTLQSECIRFALGLADRCDRPMARRGKRPAQPKSNRLTSWHYSRD